jgi:hypothetical protein
MTHDSAVGLHEVAVRFGEGCRYVFFGDVYVKVLNFISYSTWCLKHKLLLNRLLGHHVT